MLKSIREECGLAAIVANIEVSRYLYYCLHALQHRGQEACGIVCFDGKKLHSHKHFGLVSDNFTPTGCDTLRGQVGAGHVRYSTQGGQDVANIQPFSFSIPPFGLLSLAHNGNITNATLLRRELEATGAIFRSSSDTEVFMHLLARAPGKTLVSRLQEVKQQVKGAYALVLTAGNKIYGLRDPFGFRPLVIGKRQDLWVLASESCALDLIEAEFVREVLPAEIVQLDMQTGITSFTSEAKQHSFCAFELIYFARPDSLVDGQEVYAIRKAIGRQLADEDQATQADVVIAVPDSGVPMAFGYGEQAGLPVEAGFMRNHYVGRTFIQPDQQIRDFAVRLKLNPLPRSLQGKRVVVVDDSLVRGTTAQKILRVLRNRGVKEIHLRIGSPPITHSCFYGVDTPERSQLIAAQQSTAQICRTLGADTLQYLSLPALHKALGKAGHCTACFTGEYREAIFQKITKQPCDAEDTSRQPSSYE